MLVYWTMFGLPAISALTLRARNRLVNTGLSFGAIALLLLFTLLVGLRDGVGTDWPSYQRTMMDLSYSRFLTALAYKDPGFGVVGWLSTRLGSGIYGANFVAAALLMFGLARFVSRQRDPWLALTAAVPYLVIVVGMGYVRQAAAIGLILVAITKLETRQFYHFLGWIIAAALFHGSSLCVVPIAALAIVRDKKALLIPIGLLSIILYIVLLRQRVDSLYENYLEEAKDSSGALIRLIMNAVPAVIFFRYRKRLTDDPLMTRFWLLCSGMSVMLVAFPFVLPSSTFADRLGLYFIPLQVYVFGNLASVVSDARNAGLALNVGVVAYYTFVLFVWLNYASHARDWLPYQFVGLS